MNINDMTDEEKSVALSSLSGVYADLHAVSSFYKPSNMIIATYVIKWALDSDIETELTLWLDKMTHETDNRNHARHAPRWWFALSNLPEWQRPLLDKILELAIEAGLVEGMK